MRERRDIEALLPEIMHKISSSYMISMHFLSSFLQLLSFLLCKRKKKIQEGVLERKENGLNPLEGSNSLRFDPT